jgi:hypothetical protein
VRLDTAGGNDAVAVNSNNALLDIRMGSGNDTVTVAGSAGALRIDGGDGNDRIRVKAHSAALTVHGGAGDDTIHLGSITADAHGLLSGLRGAITVEGGAGNDTLVLDDRAELIASRGVLQAALVSGLGLASPLAYGTLEDLQLLLGSGDDVLQVTTTHDGNTRLNAGGGNNNVVVVAAAGTLQVETGAGNDTIGIRAVAARTEVRAGLGDDVINLSAPGRGVSGNTATGGAGRPTSGTLNHLRGLVVVDGEGGNDLLFLDDTGDTAANIGSLGVVDGSAYGTVTGLGMAQGVQYTRIANLSVKLGAGNDTVEIDGTHAGITTLDTGGGNDTVLVLRADQGETSIYGNTGNDAVNVRRAAAPLGVFGGVGDNVVNLGGAGPAGQAGVVPTIHWQTTALASIPAPVATPEWLENFLRSGTATLKTTNPTLGMRIILPAPPPSGR